MSGQNARINRKIEEINRLIEEYRLDLIYPVEYLDEDENVSNKEIKEKRNLVKKDINRVIGELTTLSMPASNRTERKKMEYKNMIEKLDEIYEELERVDNL